MVVVKKGNVKILNHVVCPRCGAAYDDVRPSDIHWVDGHVISFDAIRCQFCGNEIEIKR